MPMASQQISLQAISLRIFLTEQCVSLALEPFFYESFTHTLNSASQNHTISKEGYGSQAKER